MLGAVGPQKWDQVDVQEAVGGKALDPAQPHAPLRPGELVCAEKFGQRVAAVPNEALERVDDPLGIDEDAVEHRARRLRAVDGVLAKVLEGSTVVQELGGDFQVHARDAALEGQLRILGRREPRALPLSLSDRVLQHEVALGDALAPPRQLVRHVDQARPQLLHACALEAVDADALAPAQHCHRGHAGGRLVLRPLAQLALDDGLDQPALLVHLGRRGAVNVRGNQDDLGAGHAIVHRVEPRRHHRSHLALKLVRARGDIRRAQDAPDDDKDGPAHEEVLVRQRVDGLPGEVLDLEDEAVRLRRQVPPGQVDADGARVFVDALRAAVGRHHRLDGGGLAALALADHDQLDRPVDGARVRRVGLAQVRDHSRAPLLGDFGRRAREADVARAVELFQAGQGEQRLEREGLEAVLADV